MNKNLQKNNKSGYAGIVWDKKNEKWEVSIKVNRKRTWLGRHKELKDAIEIRKKAIAEYHKEFGNTII